MGTAVIHFLVIILLILLIYHLMPEGCGWILAIAVAVIVLGAIAVHSETLRCSTSFNGYKTCSSLDGYKSFEWHQGGYRYGADNAGNKWSTWRGVGGEVTTNRREGR
jgi:hypothetical protein